MKEQNKGRIVTKNCIVEIIKVTRCPPIAGWCVLLCICYVAIRMFT